MPSIEGLQKEYNIQSDITPLLGKDYKVKKVMKFLKEMRYLKNYKHYGKLMRSA